MVTCTTQRSLGSAPGKAAPHLPGARPHMRHGPAARAHVKGTRPPVRGGAGPGWSEGCCRPERGLLGAPRPWPERPPPLPPPRHSPAPCHTPPSFPSPAPALRHATALCKQRLRLILAARADPSLSLQCRAQWRRPVHGQVAALPGALAAGLGSLWAGRSMRA